MLPCGEPHRSARSRCYLLTAYSARDKRHMEVHMYNVFQWFVCRFDAINRLQFRVHSIGCFMRADRGNFPQLCSKVSNHHEQESGIRIDFSTMELIMSQITSYLSSYSHVSSSA